MNILSGSRNVRSGVLQAFSVLDAVHKGLSVV